jgi:ribosomal protein S18 acetylase RimI-like enzyme
VRVSAPAKARTRVATVDDAAQIARLLRDFNAEFGDPAPDQSWLRDRIAELLRHGATAVMLLETAGEATGLALMRFRPSLWADADECYLAELYVVPALRGRGLGRRLLTAAMHHANERGATYMDLTTTNQDTAAMALYESVGFDRHERRGPDTVSYYYEIDLPAFLEIEPDSESI